MASVQERLNKLKLFRLKKNYFFEDGKHPNDVVVAEICGLKKGEAETSFGMVLLIR